MELVVPLPIPRRGINWLLGRQPILGVEKAPPGSTSRIAAGRSRPGPRVSLPRDSPAINCIGNIEYRRFKSGERTHRALPRVERIYDFLVAATER